MLDSGGLAHAAGTEDLVGADFCAKRLIAKWLGDWGTARELSLFPLRSYFVNLVCQPTTTWMSEFFWSSGGVMNRKRWPSRETT